MLKKYKKGFAMVFIVLASFVIIFMCLIGFVFFKFSLNMVDESSKLGENKLSNNPEIFNVEKVRFYDDSLLRQLESNSSLENMTNCDSLEKVVIIDLLFNLTKVPEVCEIKVDNNLDKILPVDISYSMDIEEIVIPVPLKKHSSTENHLIETCCDRICTKNVLEAICFREFKT